MRQLTQALRHMPYAHRNGALAAVASVVLSGCSSAPPAAPLEPSAALAEFSSRRLDVLLPELPPLAQGWDRSQWLAAALRLNPRLSEERAEVAAVAAAERTAAERPNPTIDLFGEYLTTAAQSTAWLYGLSAEFLLRRPGERDRARRAASAETALAQSELAESIWQVRAAVRQALLDQVFAQDESSLLQSLAAEREALLESDRARLRSGDTDRAAVLEDERELAVAEQRRRDAEARRLDASARLAAAVGIPQGALAAVPVRWTDWADIGRLTTAQASRWRSEALIGRPQIVGALREYEVAEIALQGEVAKRWPQLRLTPGYSWGPDGLVEEATESGHEQAVGLSFELPIFNQHRGAIAEALARRTLAGEHLKAVQAEIFGEIERAELAWGPARQAWQHAREFAGLAARQGDAEQRALRAGASDRGSVLAAQLATTEAQLVALQAAHAAQLAFGALEDAYHRPLQGEESSWPTRAASHS